MAFFLFSVSAEESKRQLLLSFYQLKGFWWVELKTKSKLVKNIENPGQDQRVQLFFALNKHCSNKLLNKNITDEFASG